MLIPKETSAAKKAVELQKYHIGSTFKVVGAITTAITIDQLTIDDPAEMTQAIIDDDANWQQRTSGTTAWQLDADNLSLVVDGALGWTRLNKTSIEDVGVSHKW